MQKKIAVFPGSFDPITLGHESIVLRIMPLFDEIIVAIGNNNEKNYTFPLEKRLRWIKDVFADYPKVKVDSYSGLTAEYCKKVGAKYLVRGLRGGADFEYENTIGQANRRIYEDLETVFLLTEPEYMCISSTVVRDVARNGGDLSKFIPTKIDITK